MADISNSPIFRVYELWRAAYKGEVAKIHELLADPAIKDMINYKMKSQGNHTALFFACYGAANADTIRALINAGADPFMRDNHGRLPLHLAANTQDSELIAALLDVPFMREFRLDAESNTGQTPLHALFLPTLGVGSAVKSKNADISKCLPLFLEVGNDPLGALRKKDNNGLSTLTLVKHYNLKSAFHPFVPPKTFEILLKSISIPGNIEELLNSDNNFPSLESAFEANDNFAVIAEDDAIVRPRMSIH